MTREEQLIKMGGRIRDARLALGMSQEMLAIKVGYKTRSSINKIEKGRADIPQTMLKSIASALHTTAGELLGNSDNYTPFPPSHRLPIIGRIACGTPIMASENTEGYTSVPDSWRADFCLVCRGDSMAPKILDGDVVAIRHQQTADNGQIAVVVIDGEATLKRVYLRAEKGRLELHPINPEYETIVYSDDEIESVRIDGIAVGICRAL